MGKNVNKNNDQEYVMSAIRALSRTELLRLLVEAISERQAPRRGQSSEAVDDPKDQGP